MSLTPNVPDPQHLRSILDRYQPNLPQWAQFYRDLHTDPDISGMEANTAKQVASQLERLGYKVYSMIGGHGVVGVLRNGSGKTVLIRAELDALPMLEQTNLEYRSRRRMKDRHGNEHPVMHSCGHDMHMAVLLAAADLLDRAAEHWTGTLMMVFQPDAKEGRGAEAMVNGGLYQICGSRVPDLVPDLMLAQHLSPAPAGTLEIRSGLVQPIADVFDIRVYGGYRGNVKHSNLYIDPIPLSMRIVSELQEAITSKIGTKEFATVKCRRFDIGKPDNENIPYADILLVIHTVKDDIRSSVLQLVKDKFRTDCQNAMVPRNPNVLHTARAPLMSNDDAIALPVRKVFRDYFGKNAFKANYTQSLARGCDDDFSTLGAAHNVPYAYYQRIAQTRPAGLHSPLFAPDIDATLKTGTYAMALAVLTFLAK
ncbi:metal-dependent amidase/aminoacylase/carboxypeptidase [Podospora fimiseda]|uniref:Metal-dependent amidase/aminoacylase/carboxypeptidase n=1 Tax=Podospora fimiseda TaxID=252190 RepID=A0AAN7BRX8_9PEZI|nr:metal-dependent amidase/aminoacylase/carboxypeptidase [Podospora fimiseda]